MYQITLLPLLICLIISSGAFGFTSINPGRTITSSSSANNIAVDTSSQNIRDISSTYRISSAFHSTAYSTQTSLYATSDGGADQAELIARRIVVVGDVNGGYYRSCVKNEGSRFRNLVGTMTPPDDNDSRAEIYVEGKRKMVESFIRWCERGDVGLSQTSTVDSVSEEDPTGLYEEFYVDTGRK